MSESGAAVPLEAGPEPDASLLQRIAARDAAAVGDLYDRYSRLLFGLIMRILRNRSDAEEVLQEVFVRVWTHAEQYDATLGAPGPWLVRVARNRAIDRLRARRPSADVGPGADDGPAAAAAVAGTDASPEAAASAARTGEAVRGALATLPAEQRVLIEAAFFEGFTHSELAARFGLPLGTVKTRVRAGMSALRSRLEHAV
jgi:RNA polymerase sigma-70 factor (ECF subfamily)